MVDLLESVCEGVKRARKSAPHFAPKLLQTSAVGAALFVACVCMHAYTNWM